MSNRILLTGGTGFIGRAVLAKLLGEGHRVVATCRAVPSFEHPRLRWHAIDLLGADAAAFTAMFDGVTHCVHAAWYTNHADYLVHEVNREWAGASLRLADAFWATGGRRFVALGTCIEYDLDAGGLCAEGTTPLGPDTLYGRAKLQLYRDLEARGRDFAWPRIFFVYGPGDRPGRFIPALLENLARGEVMEPRFGGLRRDYIHVDDLAGQIARIALGGVTGPINTGTGEAPTLAGIAQVAAELLGQEELARANDETGDQPPLIVADLARFRREVGEPEARSIRAGLASLIEGGAE